MWSVERNKVLKKNLTSKKGVTPQNDANMSNSE